MISFKSYLEEGERGLWDNIHAKRKRIKAGSGERMRKPGEKGRPTAADFKASQTKVKEQFDLGEAIDPEHPVAKEYKALKQHDIKTLRTMIKGQQKIVDTSEYRTKDHAISAYLRHKHGDKKVATAMGLSEELDEAQTPQQKMDFEKMMKGAMSRDAYNAKWKKPMKSSSKVIYGKNIKEELSADEQFDLIEEMVTELANKHNIDPEVIWEKFESIDDEELYEAAVDAKGHKSSTGGLTQKGRDAYNAKGAHLQAPVTTPPSELKAGSKAANRRKSFCARMGGMKSKLTSAKTAKDPDSRINKALRKWNC